MTTDELRAARREWAFAQMDLDRALTPLVPAAAAHDGEGGLELQRLLTEETAHEVSRLYGRAVGAWAKYRELLRLTTESSPGP